MTQMFKSQISANQPKPRFTSQYIVRFRLPTLYINFKQQLCYPVLPQLPLADFYFWVLNKTMYIVRSKVFF